jgi:hypothetical protein
MIIATSLMMLGRADLVQAREIFQAIEKMPDPESLGH